MMPFCSEISGGSQLRRILLELSTVARTFVGGAEGAVHTVLNCRITW